jgi:hypothetical protein
VNVGGKCAKPGAERADRCGKRLEASQFLRIRGENVSIFFEFCACESQREGIWLGILLFDLLPLQTSAEYISERMNNTKVKEHKRVLLARLLSFMWRNRADFTTKQKPTHHPEERANGPNACFSAV